MSISARVFGYPVTTPTLGNPVGEGPEVYATARPEWRLVDLDLPTMPFGDYAVQAKVYMRDDRHREERFDPWDCYASRVTYGFQQETG